MGTGTGPVIISCTVTMLPKPSHMLNVHVLYGNTTRECLLDAIFKCNELRNIMLIAMHAGL